MDGVTNKLICKCLLNLTYNILHKHLKVYVVPFEVILNLILIDVNPFCGRPFIPLNNRAATYKTRKYRHNVRENIEKIIDWMVI